MRFCDRCFAFLVVALAGCGGRVVVDPAASGSGGAASGSSSVVSSSASTGAGEPYCPTLAPNEGDPCDAPGLVCPTSICCEGDATCTNGAWHLSPPACGDDCLACRGTTFGCAAGASVCVSTLGQGPATMSHCAFLPCWPLACSCAGSLCPGGCAHVKPLSLSVECNAP
jgi:hypothetical protein